MFLATIKPGSIVLNLLVKRTNWYKNKLEGGYKFLKEIPRNLDMCNLGSNSAINAFDYSETGLKGENWAMSPQTLSYDFRILKNYFSYLKPGGIVFIPLCPFSGCIKDFEEESLNNKYYPILHPLLITNFSRQKQKKIMRFVDTPFQVSPIKSLIRLVKDLPNAGKQKVNIANIDEDVDRFIRSWKKQFSIVNLEDSVSIENRQKLKFNSALLIEIADFCNERDLKPVIVIPPVSKALGLNFTEKFQKNYIYSYINEVLSTRQIPFLNYLNDKRFVNNGLFFDSYYLNDEGRKYFTSQLISDLGIVR